MLILRLIGFLAVSGLATVPGATAAWGEMQAAAVNPPLAIALAPLITITNDHNAAVNTLDFTLSGGAVAGLRVVTNWHDHGGRGDTIDVHQFTLAQLGSVDGALLYQEQGYDFLFLRGTVNEARGQGDFVVRYLRNALNGEYEECEGFLSRDGSGQWHAVNSRTGRIVRQARVVTWSLGISTIAGICPG